MITQRSTYQAENWTSNTKKPHLVVLQSYFRYEPISPSYDPNEFVHFYNKKSHQKIMTFITIFLSLFFRSLASFLKKLRNKSTLSTIPKRKFKIRWYSRERARQILVKCHQKCNEIQWNSMKFIKILARPLWLDFEGALKKNLILETLFWSSIHTLKMMCFPFLTLFFALFREFLYEVFF